MITPEGCWPKRPENPRPRTSERKSQFVETGGVIEVRSDRLVVRFEKRSHNPILREAALDKDCPPSPGLHGHRLTFEDP